MEGKLYLHPTEKKNKSGSSKKDRSKPSAKTKESSSTKEEKFPLLNATLETAENSA